MRTGPRKWTEDTVKQLQLEGRGKGKREKYCPWIKVTDVSSTGRSRRVHGIKCGREHHFLSDIEWNLFLLLEHSPDIIDIREQYPLDREITLEIAAMLGIRHPHYEGTRVPTVMTTDFLVTRVRDGKEVLEAFDAKHAAEAENERAIEKLQIQKAYHEGVGIPHRLVFHSAIPLTKARNIEWFRNAYAKPGEVGNFREVSKDACRKITAEFPSYSKRNTTLTNYCSDFDFRHGYEAGTGLRASQLLLANHELATDLNNPNLATLPLAAFRVVSKTHPLPCAGES